MVQRFNKRFDDENNDEDELFNLNAPNKKFPKSSELK